MSAETRPISASAFAAAITDLPAENLYSKAVEIRNSIAHLERSNAQLQEYSDSIVQDTSIPAGVRHSVGDEDCLQAIQENTVVIERQKQRIDLLKAEVERRGGRWHEVGSSDEIAQPPDTATEASARAHEDLNGHADGAPTDGMISDHESTPELTRASTMDTTTSRGGGGRFTDEELRRQLVARMAEAEDDDDGLHL